jgi:hypothetical protein
MVGSYASGLAADVVQVPVWQLKSSFMPHGSRAPKRLLPFGAIFTKHRENNLSALPAADSRITPSSLVRIPFFSWGDPDVVAFLLDPGVLQSFTILPSQFPQPAVVHNLVSEPL